MRSVADCKAAAIWRANTLCEKHGIIKPRITYNLRGTDAGQAFLEQNRIDLNLLLFRETPPPQQQQQHVTLPLLLPDLDRREPVGARARSIRSRE